jgi:hypothetical protein
MADDQVNISPVSCVIYLQTKTDIKASYFQVRINGNGNASGGGKLNWEM